MFGFRKNDSNQPKDESIDQSVLDSIREKLANGSVDQLSDHVSHPSFVDNRNGFVNTETQEIKGMGSVQPPRPGTINSATPASSRPGSNEDEDEDDEDDDYQDEDDEDEDDEDEDDEDEDDDASFASASPRHGPINSAAPSSSRPGSNEDEDEDDEDDDYQDEDDEDEDEDDEDEDDDASFASASPRPGPINSAAPASSRPLESGNTTQAPPPTMAETEKKVKNTINSGITNLSQQLGTIRDHGGLDFSQNMKIQVFDMFSKLAELEVKKWIIANLPSLVESLTKEEVSRIIKNSIKDSNS